MKKQIIILLTALSSFSAVAQSIHEFSIYAGGGLSTLNYSLQEGNRSNGLGGDFGVGYAYFFSEHWGVNTGLGLALYNAKATFNNGTTIITPTLQDNEGDIFDMHTTLNGYEEKQNTTFLNIPVMLQYQTGNTNKFYAQGGVKVSIPLSGSYETNSNSITNKGYYPEYDNWATTQKFMGFGIFLDKKSENDLDLKVLFMLSAEAGMKWAIGEKLSLYTGLYFDYGLNDIVAHDKPFVNYSVADPENFSTNSSLESLTDKVSNMAIGVKVKLAVGMKKIERSESLED